MKPDQKPEKRLRRQSRKRTHAHAAGKVGGGRGGWEKGSEDESKAGFCVTIGAMIDKRTTRDLVTLDLTPSHKTIAKITIVDDLDSSLYSHYLLRFSLQRSLSYSCEAMQH